MKHLSPFISFQLLLIIVNERNQLSITKDRQSCCMIKNFYSIQYTSSILKKANNMSISLTIYTGISNRKLFVQDLSWYISIDKLIHFDNKVL